ncbi:Transposon Ty3-G Gag-Pol poly, partial [Paramuricea clavata]
MAALPTFPAFDLQAGDLSREWRKYVSRFENMLLSMNITSAVRKKAMLLLYVGEEVNEIFETLEVQAADENEDVFTKAEKALKQLAKYCEFHDEKREIKTQIVQNGISSKLRRKTLADPEITLEKLIQIAKSMELSEVQADGIESANQLTKKTGRREINQQRNESQSKSKCRFCGYQHVLGKNNCPAYGKQCRGCRNEKREASKRNEQSKFAKRNEQSKRSGQLKTPSGGSRRVNNLNGPNVESSSEDEYVFSTLTVSAMSYQKLPKFKVKINETPINVMAGTGASVNILDEATFAKLRTNPKLSGTNGKKYFHTAQTNRYHSWASVIAKGTTGCLVSWKGSQRLGLVQVVQSVEHPGKDKVESLVESYSDLFEGLGKLKGFQVRLHVENNVQPIAQPPRRVPFHVREKLEEQLLNDEKLGVIEKTVGPTPWVSPVVVVPKKEGKIRRERHITPTINEVINDLNGAKIFSKLDLNQGYNQLELAPESRNLTKFSTHLGLRRFRRLNFGINCAAEIFQNAIREALSGLKGALNISDDILIYGTDDDDHDANLEAALERLRERGLTLNKGKCIFKKKSLIFQGYVFSEHGISPDPAKVTKIKEFATPKDASEVRSLLGMTNFCCRFVKNYATLTQPLRELIKNYVPFVWTGKQERALEKHRNPVKRSLFGHVFNGWTPHETCFCWGLHQKLPLTGPPYWPRANGEVERFMRAVKKVIKAAVMENKVWKQEMQKFLRNYRATPHTSTKTPPATALFGRPMKTRLPQIGKESNSQDDFIRKNDDHAKLKMNGGEERINGHCKERLQIKRSQENPYISEDAE